MSTETLTAPIQSTAPESALAADIGAAAAVLRDLVTHVSTPTGLAELATALQLRADALVARVTGLGGGADLDGVLLAERTRTVVPPELRNAVGRPGLEGDML